MVKTGLVMSGGGSKGAFSVGVIEKLYPHFNFDTIIGTSTGSLIAPLVALGDLDRLVQDYTTVTNKDVIRHNWRRLWINGLFDDTPLRRRVREGMFSELPEGDTRYDRLMASEKEVLLCSVSLQTGVTKYFSQRKDYDWVDAWNGQDNFIEAVLGSTNQPLFMPPAKIGKDQLVDGGVKEVAPITAAVRAGCKRVFVVINADIEMDRQDSDYNNIVTIGFRTLSVMVNEILNNDIFMMEYLSMKYGIEFIFIRPDKSLPSDGLTFEPEVMQRMRHLGHVKGEQVLAELGVK